MTRSRRRLAPTAREWKSGSCGTPIPERPQAASSLPCHLLLCEGSPERHGRQPRSSTKQPQVALDGTSPKKTPIPPQRAGAETNLASDIGGAAEEWSGGPFGDAESAAQLSPESNPRTRAVYEALFDAQAPNRCSIALYATIALGRRPSHQRRTTSSASAKALRHASERSGKDRDSIDGLSI